MTLRRRLTLLLSCVGLAMIASGCATNFRETDPFGYYQRAGSFDSFPSSVHYTGYYGRPWARY
jgi:hypothetical protein